MWLPAPSRESIHRRLIQRCSGRPRRGGQVLHFAHAFAGVAAELGFVRPMTMRVLLVLLFLAGWASAATPPRWPKVVHRLSPDDFKPVFAANLPEGIALYAHDGEMPEARAQRILHIASVDLNGDGVPELLVSADEGGSAGVYCDVYQRHRTEFKSIGWLGAVQSVTLLSRFHGYYQLEVWSRGGGGYHTRELFRFEHGSFHSIRIDDFREAGYLGTRKPEA